MQLQQIDLASFEELLAFAVQHELISGLHARDARLVSKEGYKQIELSGEVALDFLRRIVGCFLAGLHEADRARRTRETVPDR